MVAARQMRDMGRVCRAYRYHPDNTSPSGKPVPQEWVAAWVGVSQVQVCRIERGVNRVRDIEKLIRWARALRMPASFAWFDLPHDLGVSGQTQGPCTFAGKETEEENVKRRTLLAGGFAAGISTAASTGSDVEPWERRSRAKKNPHLLAVADVDQLEHDTTDFFRREEFEPARKLAPDLRRHIEDVNQVLTGSPPDALRGRLLSAVGEALALYGWFTFDRNDKAAASRFYDLADSAARDAHDGALRACILGYRSYLVESTGDPRSARDMLVAAQEHTRTQANAATRSWLAAREAEVRGSLREDTDALRALDRATTAYDYARPHHERSWTGFFTGSRIGSMAVTTYTRMQHPQLGETADSVLATIGPNDAKTKAIILADLAVASMHCEAYDRAAVQATSALAVTTSREVSIGADRLRSLRQLIALHRDVPLLADLDQRLAATLT